MMEFQGNFFLSQHRFGDLNHGVRRFDPFVSCCVRDNMRGGGHTAFFDPMGIGHSGDPEERLCLLGGAQERSENSSCVDWKTSSPNQGLRM